MHRTDEWILGEGCDTTTRYLVHTAAPRFVCRIATKEEGRDLVVSGLAAGLADGRLLHTFLWIDPPPAEPELGDLVAEAEHALIRDSLKETLDE